MFVYTVSLMIGTAGLPHVIVRFFTVPKVKDARSSAGWALVFIAILYTTAPAVAAMAKMNLLKTINPAVMTNASVFAPESSLVYDQRPDWMKRWEVTGLLKFEDKNGDGRIQYYNDKSKNEQFLANAAAAGWQGSELTVNADIMVLANPEIALLPNWVIALVAAGGLAAALSTAAGLLLAISSAISHDLLKEKFMPNLTEKGELMAGKIAMAGCDYRRRLPRPQSSGLRRRHRGHRLRSGRQLHLPSPDDGYLQQDHEQAGRHGRHARRYRHHHVLRLCPQRDLLYQRHRIR